MEQKNDSLFSNRIVAGIILGVAMVVYSLLLYITGQTLNKALGYINLIIMIGGLVWLIKSYRDESLGGYISYGNALGTGVLISLIASVVLAIYTFALYSFIDPGLIDKTLEMTRSSMMEKGLKDEQIEMALSMTKKMMNPIFITIISVVSTTFFGFIFSLVIGAFLKKEQPVS